MPKRSEDAPEAGGPPENAASMEDVEKLALERASRAISDIENAVAVWDASREKPESLRPRIEKLRYFCERLSDWEKRMLVSRGGDIETRVVLLREFSSMCKRYS